MSFARLILRRFSPACIVLAAAISAGCRPEDQIAQYTVPKPEIVDPRPVSTTSPAEAVPQQTLGAIVVVDDAGWFFKLTGDPAAVGPKAEAFQSFVKSVKFPSGAAAKPTWSLPEGWNELPGDQFRFATLQMPADGGRPLEISVSELPMRTELEEYLLSNINRWRGQVSLPPITAAELSQTTEPISVGEHAGTFVSLVGKSSGQGMMGAPFAGGASTAGSAVPRSDGPGDDPPGAGVAFAMPEGWQKGTLNAFRKVAFVVADGDQRAEITVIDLDLEAGKDLVANVNRWRQQVNLPPITEVDLAPTVQKIPTLGTEGDYVELIGTGERENPTTILGVSALAGGRSWYIKLTGDSALATREKPKFEAFVKSLQLK